MNRIILFSLLALPFAGIAQDPIEVPSKVQAVTVYPRGAQVERFGSKFLSAGRHVLSFPGLPSELDPSTISVSADGAISVLSVSSFINHLKNSDKPKPVQVLEDSLHTYEFDLRFNQNMLGVYAEERKMILANQKVGWETSEFVIEDLEDLSDFYRDRLADIMLKEMELQNKQNRLNQRIQRIKAQLSEHNAKLTRSTGVILVEVQVPSNGNANFKLAYMVQNAGWVPSYNVNVTDVDRPLQLSYNAQVFQNTGVDWDGVTLVLTNANPNLSGQKPEMHPWRLYFVEEYATIQRGTYKAGLLNAGVTEDAAPAMALMAESDQMTVEYPVNEAVTQFRIATKHNIPSNGKPQVINIDVFSMPATYQYYVAPKLDPTAFLIARVSGFEQYDLLPGNANLFLGNTYVGQAIIDPSVTSDTLDLSLGRDQSITIKREKIKEYASTKKLGGTTKSSTGVRISIRNTKATKISLVIEDQVPVSSDKSIEVSLGESNGAKHDGTTGKLRWIKVIQGNSSELIEFKFDVKYPSDKKVNL
jgi:uncharacterized protein (TIGR02231 family)